MIRQGRPQGRPCRGVGLEGAREQFSPGSQLKEGRQIQICKGIKSLSTEGGGITVVRRGAKGIIGPVPSYFTDLAWAAPVILRRGESSVLSFDLWQYIGIKTTRTTDK